MPGYLKDVGGTKRMRFVKPGYDPDDMTVPPNQVIFDSESDGTLSLLYIGEWTSATSTASGLRFNGAIRTWSALPYIPLVVAQYRDGYGNPVGWEGWKGYTNSGSFLNGHPDARGFRMHVTNSGIFVRWVGEAGGTSTIGIRYQVFRIPT